jgi:diguanylate cyclase (GGDEF)-like protein
LIEFANKLKTLFKNDLIGRWGGDEFLVCTKQSKESIEKNIIEINKTLNRLQIEFDKDMEKTLSASAGGYIDIGKSFEERFKKADLALYKVKKSQKGKCAFFDENED